MPDRFFEMSLDCLAIAGFDGYLRRVSPSWTRTLGWSDAELKARPSIELVHPDDRAGVIAARDNLMRGLPLRGLVNRYQCKDGSYRWFEWRSIADLEQQVVFAAARDVTEERELADRLREATKAQDQMQRQLIFADRMASVGTLAAGVAHEINNPLAYVIGNLEMLIEELQATSDMPPTRTAPWIEIAAQARDGAQRIGTIVRGLKTFSRAEDERRAIVDLHGVLELAIGMAHNEIRHRARLIRDYGAVPPVVADEARLGQVFVNLLVNAAQALPDDGSATHSIRIVTSSDATGRAVIAIQDTGTGIPAQVVDRMFDPFFTTKPVGIGTGLGLWICHNIITGLGGEISAANRPEGGAIIRVVLPGAAASVSVPPVPRAAPTLPEASPDAPRASVLVVDDDRAVGSSIGRALRGFDVAVVETARAALDLILAGKVFDVIVSDLMMPEMSGMELHDEITRMRPELAARMVFVTGGAFTAAAHAFLDRVPNPRIDKPFEVRALRDVIRTMIADGER